MGAAETMNLLDAFTVAPTEVVTAAGELGRVVRQARLFMPGQGQQAYDWAVIAADAISHGQPTAAGPAVKSKLATIGTWIGHPMVAQAIAEAVGGA